MVTTQCLYGEPQEKSTLALGSLFKEITPFLLYLEKLL
jgi:hypothetical protein